MNSLIATAIYPVLAGHYMVSSGITDERVLASEFILATVVVMRLFDFSGLMKYVCMYVYMHVCLLPPNTISLRFNYVIFALSIFPSILYIAYAIPHIDPALWADTKGIYACEVPGANGTYANVDDDWVIDEGTCQVPLAWGSLLSYSLWMVSLPSGVC